MIRLVTPLGQLMRMVILIVQMVILPMSQGSWLGESLVRSQVLRRAWGGAGGRSSVPDQDQAPQQ